MILLAAMTDHALAFDPLDGRYRIIHEGLGPYYGIAYSGDTIWIAARRRQPNGPERPMLVSCRPDLAEPAVTRLASHVRDVHQAAWFDGWLWLVVSGRDSVLRMRGDKGEPWHPGGRTGRDTHHFNSIWCDGKQLAVLAHNKGPSEIWRFSYPALEPTGRVRIGDTAHNVWLEDGQWAVCDSGAGTVRTLRRVLAEPGGYTRGVARTPDVVAVGASGVASMRTHGSGRRDARKALQSLVHVYDGFWRPIRSWRLPVLGQIGEIRAPGHDDRAYSGYGVMGPPVKLGKPDGVMHPA